MLCPKCGSNLEDDAQFCGVCGEPIIPQQQIPSTPVAFASTQSYTKMPQTEAPAIPQESNNKRLIIITAAVISVIVIASIAFSLVFTAFKNREQMTPRPIQVFIEAQGYSDQCTKIPVTVVGTDSAGTSVDTVGFIDGSGNGLEVAPGIYELSFPASPLTPDGILYEPPSDKAQFTIDKDSSSTVPVSVFDDDPAVFKKMTAETETDSMIDDAYEYAIMDDEQIQKADELIIIATSVHEKAVEEKEKEKQRQAAEAARTIDMPHYTLKIPEYWVGKVKVEKDGDDVSVYANGGTKENGWIVNVSLVPQSYPEDMGDYMSGVIKSVNTSGGYRAELSSTCYPAMACFNNTSRISDDLLNTCIELETGGEYTLSKIRSDHSGTDYSRSEKYSKIWNTYISNNVTLTAK